MVRGVDLDHTPDLQGDRVRLRGFTEGDAARRATFGRSREVNRGFGGSLQRDLPMTEDEALADLRKRFGSGPHWVIADEADELIGSVRLAPIDLANRSARFGIGIYDPDRLGDGLGSEATLLAVRYGFEALQLHRISLTVLADNHRAIAAYRKCGFVEEGRLRDTLWRDGCWHDDIVMAIVAPSG